MHVLGPFRSRHFLQRNVDDTDFSAPASCLYRSVDRNWRQFGHSALLRTPVISKPNEKLCRGSSLVTSNKGEYAFT